MQGFKGRVFCTAGTRDLCRIVLPDSGRIQEEDAANANRNGFSRHAPALPLYGEADAFRAVSLLQPVGYERAMPVAEGIEVDFLAAGHLLGSAYARVRTEGMTILFGGDLGRYGRPVLPDPGQRRLMPTTCSWSRLTATGFTKKTTTASSSRR